MKRSTLIMVVLVLVFVGMSTAADANGAWKPSGYVAASVSSKNIGPTMSCLSYDDPYVLVDAWLDLPGGFAVEVDEYKGLQNSDFDNDGVDEFDAYLWKKFVVSQATDLKFRAAYFNCSPVSDMNGEDLLAYDVYLSHVIGSNSLEKAFSGKPVVITAQMRVQYWHYVRDFDEGMISVMPSTFADCAVSSRLSVYERLGLQWNDELAPFGKLLSGQMSLGANYKLTSELVWNVVDVTGVIPLTDVDDGDPRSQNGAVAFTTGLTYNF